MGFALIGGAILGSVVGAIVGHRIDKHHNESGAAWVGGLMGIVAGMTAVYFGAMLIGA